MWTLKQDTNELIYKTEQTQRQREQTCSCQEGGGAKDWEFGVSRCKLFYIE